MARIRLMLRYKFPQGVRTGARNRGPMYGDLTREVRLDSTS